MNSFFVIHNTEEADIKANNFWVINHFSISFPSTFSLFHFLQPSHPFSAILRAMVLLSLQVWQYGVVLCSTFSTFLFTICLVGFCCGSKGKKRKAGQQMPIEEASAELEHEEEPVEQPQLYPQQQQQKEVPPPVMPPAPPMPMAAPSRPTAVTTGVHRAPVPPPYPTKGSSRTALPLPSPASSQTAIGNSVVKRQMDFPRRRRQDPPSVRITISTAREPSREKSRKSRRASRRSGRRSHKSGRSSRKSGRKSHKSKRHSQRHSKRSSQREKSHRSSNEERSSDSDTIPGSDSASSGSQWSKRSESNNNDGNKEEIQTAVFVMETRTGRSKRDKPSIKIRQLDPETAKDVISKESSSIRSKENEDDDSNRKSKRDADRKSKKEDKKGDNRKSKREVDALYTTKSLSHESMGKKSGKSASHHHSKGKKSKKSSHHSKGKKSKKSGSHHSKVKKSKKSSHHSKK